MKRIHRGPVLVAVAFVGWAPAPARAQSPPTAEAAPACGSHEGHEAGPRQALLLEERREKCARLEPYKAGFIERQILAIENAERPPINRVNLFGFYPRIASIDHRSQLAPGVRLWHPDIGSSRFDLTGSAFWSLQGFQYYDLQAGRLPHRGRSFPRYARKSDDVFELAKVRADDDDRPGPLRVRVATGGRPSSTSSGAGPTRARRTTPTSASVTCSWRAWPATGCCPG